MSDLNTWLLVFVLLLNLVFILIVIIFLIVPVNQTVKKVNDLIPPVTKTINNVNNGIALVKDKICNSIIGPCDEEDETQPTA